MLIVGSLDDLGVVKSYNDGERKRHMCLWKLQSLTRQEAALGIQQLSDPAHPLLLDVHVGSLQRQPLGGAS